jgi:type IV pilus assembly protein PilN
MIRINLMPRAEARRQAARQRDRQVLVLMACLLLAIVFVTEFYTRRSANRVQRLSDQYQAELAQLSQKHNAAIQLDLKRKELESKLATIKLLERQRTGPVHVLDDLGAATPDALWLTEMRESGGTMTLLGRGLDNQTIALFMRNLAASPYFANVDLVETKQVEEGPAKLKEFSIRTNVLYAGRAMPAPATADQNGAKPAAQPPPPPAPAPASPTDSAPPPAAAQQSAQQGAAPSGLFAAPAAARHAAAVSDSRNALQDQAAHEAAGEPRS